MLITFSMHDIFLLDVKSRFVHMQYYPEMEQYLVNLGLYQIVNILQTEPEIINVSLIAGLVERWSLETHTFHMPFGEMTVTLQDVSALWGLPIGDTPIGGVSGSVGFAH